MGFNIKRDSNSFIALHVSLVEIIGVVGFDFAGGFVPINYCSDTIVQDYRLYAQHLKTKHSHQNSKKQSWILTQHVRSTSSSSFILLLRLF